MAAKFLSCCAGWALSIAPRLAGLVLPLLVVSAVAQANGQTHLTPPILPKITPPEFEGQSATVKLPAAAEDLCVGGGGRFIILNLKSVQKLAFFDVAQAKVVKYLPLGSDNAAFAAGADKLIVVLRDKNVIQRWSLESFERELTLPIDTKHEIADIYMGSASNGPVLIGSGDYYDTGHGFYDIQTLKPAKIEAPKSLRVHTGRGAHVRVSSDGKTMGMWRTGVSPSGLQVVLLENSTIASKYDHTSVGPVIPSADGRYILTMKGIYAPTLKRLSDIAGPPIPAVSGIYYLTVGTSESRREEPSELTLYMFGRDAPLLTLSDIPGPKIDRFGRGQSPIPTDKRYVFIPQAELVVRLAEADNELILHRLNVLEELDKSGIDYLYVASSPPGGAFAPGDTFSYQLDVRSKAGGVQYTLESGPSDMKFDPNGNLQWQIPSDADSSNETVIVSIRDDSGQEDFHTFSVQVKPTQGASHSSQRIASTRPEPEVRLDPVDLPSPSPPSKSSNPFGVPADETERELPFRSWTDDTGKNEVEARFVSAAGTLVTLMRRDGRTLKVSLSRLSDFDKGYVEGVQSVSRQKPK